MIVEKNFKVAMYDNHGTVLEELEGRGDWSVVANISGGTPLFIFEIENRKIECTCFVLIEEAAYVNLCLSGLKPHGGTARLYIHGEVIRCYPKIQSFALNPRGGVIITTAGREKQIATNIPMIIKED